MLRLQTLVCDAFELHLFTLHVSQTLTFALFNFSLRLFSLAKSCLIAKHRPRLYLPLYYIFAPEKVSLLKIFDEVITCSLWFAPPPSQSKILAMLMSGRLRNCVVAQRWKERFV